MSTLPRTLPMGVRPLVHGESFASLVERLAASNGASVAGLLAAVGVIDRPSFNTLPSGYGITLDQRKRLAFAHAARLDVSIVNRSLLSAYDGVAIDLSGLDLSTPRSISRVCVREWMYANGCQVCPRCVAETPAMLTAWKLPWVFACTRHRLVLASVCPECEMRPGGGRADGRIAPPLMSAVPHPGYCPNALPAGAATIGSTARPCDFPLHEIDVEEIAGGAPVLAAQMSLESLLVDSPRPGVLETFHRLRSLAALLFAVATPAELVEMTPRVARAWETFQFERDAIAVDRDGRRSSRSAGREGPRTRFWTLKPPAELMAAVMPTALAVSNANCHDDAVTALEPIYAAARRARPLHANAAAQWFPFPDDLAAAWRFLVRRSSPRAVTRATASRQNGTTYRFEPRHVPQLLPNHLYEPKLRALRGGLTDPIARTYASLCLAVLAGAPDWQQAGTEIGVEPARARGIASNASSKLTRARTTEAFWAEVERLAARYGDNPLIDYAARRALLADLELLPFNDWEAIRRAAGVARGWGDGRRRSATAWLWSELTGQPWQEAPAYGLCATESQRVMFRRFVQDLLPALQGALLEFGVQLVPSAHQ